MANIWTIYYFTLLEIKDGSFEVWLQVPYLGEIKVGDIWRHEGEKVWMFNPELLAGIKSRDAGLQKDQVGAATKPATVRKLLSFISRGGQNG